MKENSPRMRQSRKLERKAGAKPAYPRVLMVCEGRETEPNYLEGIRRFARIPSVPCFELWFLLHFEAVTRGLERDEAERNLRRQVPDYDKNLPDMFARTKERLESAYGNAAREHVRRADTGNDNPSTDVDILVKRLFEIAAMRDSGHLLLSGPA
jgi:hypothetical protein